MLIRRSLPAVLLGIGLATLEPLGCSVGALDLEGFACPCVAGWTCGPGNVCVRDGAPMDDGAVASDGGRDDGSAGTGEVFVTGQAGVFALARGPSTLYWATPAPGGVVGSCPFSGCAAPTVIASGGSPSAIAWSKRAFWSDPLARAIAYMDDAGGVGRVNIANPPLWVAAGDTANYAVDSTGTILKILYDPPQAITSSVGVQNFSPRAERLSARAGGFAWTQPSDRTIRFCGSEGCTDSGSLVAQGVDPIAIALDAASVFWADRDGSIHKASRDALRITGPVSELASGLPEPAGLEPDDAGPFLYFTARGTEASNFMDGIVGKVPKGGGEVIILARGQARPEGLVVTDTHVYWANSYEGTIVRIPK